MLKKGSLNTYNHSTSKVIHSNVLATWLVYAPRATSTLYSAPQAHLTMCEIPCKIMGKHEWDRSSQGRAILFTSLCIFSKKTSLYLVNQDVFNKYNTQVTQLIGVFSLVLQENMHVLGKQVWSWEILTYCKHV